MVKRLILVLGDQLSPELSALKEAGPDDVVVMAEVRAEATYAPHHPKKIALIFSAMRHFAHELRDDGFTVAYTDYRDSDNAGSICGELLRRAEEYGAEDVIATEPGEWRLIEALQNCPLKVRLLKDDRFLCSHAEFEDWSEGRKELRMEFFYRQMRRRTGYLMEGDDPAGGKWNFDHDNRKPAERDLLRSQPMMFDTDKITEEVLTLVEEEFPRNFGILRPFSFAVTRGQARRALSHFIKHQLPEFGAYQDAMLADEPYLNHALISPYLNMGLLTIAEVCDAVEWAWRDGDVPINSAEGFIRQVIGWREYIRGIYYLKGPDYTASNELGHDRDLPWLYWGGETKMNCLAQAVGQTGELAYAHHIQRLMVTGNFALLAGIDPTQVHEWYLSVYADAYEWVEAPNTIGMSQFADGGVIATKPYASSANYIDKMSDYCGDCHYSAKTKTGYGACPFNLLYWHFLDRHRERFAGNNRMGQIYATWDRMDADKRKTILREANAFLDELSTGKTV